MSVFSSLLNTNMSTFAVLLFCVQACLVQTIYGQCLGNIGLGLAPAAAIAPSCAGAYSGAGWAGAYPGAGWAGAYPFAAGLAGEGIAAYGGVGEGNVVVIGELPVAGTTAVAGQVPISGIVNFGGQVPAAGCVSISGQCSCGCGY